MTMTLVSTTTLGSNQTSIVFSSIAQTGTDLLILISARTDRVSDYGDTVAVNPNGATTNLSSRILYGIGSSSGVSETTSNGSSAVVGVNTQTANTFGSGQIYIPNYAGSSAKSMSSDGVAENNGSASLLGITATLWNSTAAITSITLKPNAGTNFIAGTSASLYIITKGSGGATVS